MHESKPKASKTALGQKQPDENVCAGQALGFPLQRALGFQPIENITLDVFRCVCDVYATASAQPWDVAIRIAEEQLGPAEGPLLVANVTALMRALRKERMVGFSYLSVGCRHVSPDELTVTGLLRSMRHGDNAGIERGIALALDNAAVTDRTRLAARWLAELQLRHVAGPTDQSNGKHQLETETVQTIYLH
jgi:hypothetical protein